jgi:DNA-binding LacI/PurR family transcriptional regulator
VQTVSRVLNGKAEISADTRRRVQGVIDELRFRPSASARSLASRRTMTLGLVVHDLGGSFLGRAVQAAVNEASRHGFFFVLAAVGADPRDEPAYVEMLLERRVEGLLFARASIGDDAVHLRRLVADHVPVVTIACYAPGVPLDVVDVDNLAAGRRAVAHLLDGGRRRVAQIVGPVGWRAADDRARGAAEAVTEAGLPLDERLSERAAGWDAEAGYTAARTLLRRAPGLDALFCHSDALAFGALRALREAHRRVPDDVAVVGFDDLPTAAYADPPLSSVRQPAAEAGRLAARRLIELVGAPEQARRVVELDTELVVRTSSRVPEPTARPSQAGSHL